MADYDLKVIAPDTGFTTGNFLFGADDQTAATPVPYSAAGIKTFMSASPTLVTPVIGAATGTSLALSGALTALTFNGLTITTTSGGVLTIPNSVTLTGPAASGTAMTLGNAEAVSGIKTFATGQIVNGTLRLGTISATTGQLLLANSASANLTTIQAGNAAAAVTYTWPTNVGSAGQQLTDAAGDGVLSWAAAGGGGGGTPGGSDTQVQFNDGGAFGGDAGLTFNKTTDTLTNAGDITVTRSATPRVQLTAYASAPTYGEITLGNVSAGGSTYTIISDGAEFVINSSANKLLRFSNATAYTFTSSALLFGSGADASISRNAAGVVQFGTTAANASGAWLAAKGTITAGTLADAASAMILTATQTASPTGAQKGVNWAITSAGSTSQVQFAVGIDYNAGYTGSSWTSVVAGTSFVAGTGTTIVAAAGANAPAANVGSSYFASATTTGSNIGSFGGANGGNVNVGIIGSAQFVKNSATNIGVAGTAINTGTSPVQIGGWFSLNQTTTPTVSAALIADNGAQTDPIFLARDNGTTVFTIADGAAITATGSPTIASGTGIPANGTAGVGYKFSSTSNFGIFFGSSTPSLAAAKGSLYLRSDGSGAADRAYINTDGGTTWTAIATAG